MKWIIIIVVIFAIILAFTYGCDSDDGAQQAGEVKSEEAAKETVEDVSIDLDELSNALDSISEDLN